MLFIRPTHLQQWLHLWADIDPSRHDLADSIWAEEGGEAAYLFILGA